MRYLILLVALLTGCGALQTYEVRDSRDAVAVTFSEIEGLAKATTAACCVGENPGAIITREQSGKVKTLLKDAFSANATAKFHLIDNGVPDETKLQESARLARAAADLLDQWGVDRDE